MVSRRQFLRGHFQDHRPPLRPPWALPEEAFPLACSRCGACVSACPTRIVVAVQDAYPEVDFTRGECTFCGACVTACQDGALSRAAGADRPWAIVARVAATCLSRRGVECRVCGDHCPEAAIRFRPRLGGPPLVEIDEHSCSGCGACVAPCPVSALGVA